jgi:hypothetical protein
MSKLVAALSIFLLLESAHAQGTVYRCPGSPVTYSDALTAKEAAAKGCHPIEAVSVELDGPKSGKLEKAESTGRSQSGKPPISELHSAMKNMVMQGNKQLAGSRVDEFTTLRMVTYDEPIPLLSYHYWTDHYTRTGQRNLSESERKRLRAFHIERVCTSKMRVAMREYGLQVGHNFADQSTGRNLLEVRVKYADCI